MAPSAGQLLKKIGASLWERFGEIAKLGPSFAVVLALATLIFQTSEFYYAQKQQAEASLDLQWRDALKNVSFKDPGAVLASVFTMQSFFGTKKYGKQARSVACTLLPDVSNREGFDLVFFDVVNHGTDDSNQAEIVGVARRLLKSQQDLYLTKAVPALRDNAAEFDAAESMLGATNMEDFDQQEAKDSFERAGVGVWELDSASYALQKIWSRQNTALTPPKELDHLALFDSDFRGLDFSDASLYKGVLFNSHFEKAILKKANFTGALVMHVCLDGADLSEVKKFDGSRWKDVSLQGAKASPELSAYLSKNYVDAAPDEKGKWDSGPASTDGCNLPPASPAPLGGSAGGDDTTPLTAAK